MPSLSNLTPALVDAAAAFLDGQIRRTPVEPAPLLSERVGQPVFFKLEHLQATGSFKLRGALFRLSMLDAAARARGVATCSAGNHGKGIAYAAQRLGLHATIYVPASVDAAKYRAMQALGAEVIRSAFPGYDATEAWARTEAQRRGLPFISAFDDDHIMAANGGTIAREVLQQVPEATTFVLPVGGGGHAAGFAFAVKHALPQAQVVCCQHAGCPALARSLDAGQALLEMPPIETVAGGLEGGLGRRPFEILQSRVDAVAHVSEASIYEAVRWLLDQHQYLVEPSAAVPVAAALSGQLPVLQGPTVITLSGRNVSLETLQRILQGMP